METLSASILRRFRSSGLAFVLLLLLPFAGRALDRQAIAEFGQLCRKTGADAYLVVWHDKPILEWYGPKYQAPVQTASLTKSIVGLLVGIMIDRGLLGSVDDPVSKWIPSWGSGLKAQVTIRHILTHTSGLIPTGPRQTVGWALRDKNARLVSMPLSYVPGTKFKYSNEACQLLSTIMGAASGERVDDFARKALFGPLGMRQSRMDRDKAANTMTYSNFQTTPRELARIGRLFLNKGQAPDGRQIVSQAWLEQSTTPSPLNRECGLLWWLSPDRRVIYGLGWKNNSLYVVPDHDLVLVRLQFPLRGETHMLLYKDIFKLIGRMISSPVVSQ